MDGKSWLGQKLPYSVRPMPAVNGAVICHDQRSGKACETRIEGKSRWCSCGCFYLLLRPLGALLWEQEREGGR